MDMSLPAPSVSKISVAHLTPGKADKEQGCAISRGSNPLAGQNVVPLTFCMEVNVYENNAP